jgi:hypothetical protein
VKNADVNRSLYEVPLSDKNNYVFLNIQARSAEGILNEVSKSMTDTSLITNEH